MTAIDLSGIAFDAIGPRRVLVYHEPSVGLDAVVVLDTTGRAASGGGTRMASDVTASEVARLARAMTYKYALLDLPIGGAKAGIRLDPADPRRTEVMQAFLTAVRPLIDSGTFVPAADLGTSEADFEEVFGAADVTSFEGRPLEEQLTGYGIVIAARATCEELGLSLGECRVSIEGFGKVGAGAAKFFARHGARVIAVSTLRGTVFDPDGLDVDALLALRSADGDAGIELLPGATLLTREALFEIATDILVPGARPDAIRSDNASRIHARLVVPAANAPYGRGAVAALEAREIVALPDFLANAGGVLAMVARFSGLDAEGAFALVRTRIEANVHRVMEASRETGVGAYDAAVGLAERTMAVAS